MTKVFEEQFDELYYYHGTSYRWKMNGIHIHAQYEVFLLLSDNVEFFISGQNYHLGRGDLVLIHGSVPHGSVIDEKKPYSRYVLMFDPKMFESLKDILNVDILELFHSKEDGPAVILHLTDPLLRQVEKRLQRVGEDEALGMEGSWEKAQIIADIFELLVFLHRVYDKYGEAMQLKSQETQGQAVKTAAPEKVVYHERTAQIKQYINDHIGEKLDLKTIADAFYMNPYYLSHYFKQETGFTLTDYIKKYKILAAKKMLREHVPVAEVAERLSYSTEGHFIAAFKRREQMTPGQYIQKFSKNK